MAKLGKRLLMAAEMVRDGATAADIGTDHAYLASYLVVTGKCPRTIASDLREGPLQNAAETLKAFSLEDKIELRLSDGLKKLSPDDADDFIFAGMGGTLIVDILKGADWIKDRNKRYIFQPMSRSEDVREYLTENGFVIIREDACFDECRPYIAFCARYAPEEQTVRKESYKFIGELYKCKNEAAAYYFTKKYLYLKERADALERANLLSDEVRMIKAVLPDIYPLTRKVEQ